MATYTVEDVARRVAAEAAGGTSYVMAVDWTNEAYRQLVLRARLRHLRKFGNLILPASISTGTVTATRNSKVVVGDATALAAWSTAVEGRYVRLRTAWYKIAALSVTDSALVLETEFAEEAVTAGGYYIVARHHELPVSVHWIGVMLQPRLRSELVEVSIDQLDHLFPDRTDISGVLQYRADAGVGDNGGRKIEIYPAADEVELVTYSYWEQPEPLELESRIPQFIDPGALKEGALVQAFRYLANKAAADSKIEQAAFYLNQAGRQNTLWERIMTETIRAERAADDLTAVLTYTAGLYSGAGLAGDIMTARDHIWSGWSPLT